jgi:hypothetical protein
MPFTLAHPAAVLPLRRFRFLQVLPLMIGSMVPDISYFLPRRLDPMFLDSHSVTGLFICDLPVGMALLVLTLLLREPLTVLLGPRTRWVCERGFARFSERPLHWPLALVSLLIGSWTHLAWDSFTHTGEWGTLHIAALNAPMTVLGWNTEVSRFLQYSSSVFGLAVMAIWFRRLVQATPAPLPKDAPREPAQRFLLALVGAAALAIGVIRAAVLWDAVSWYHLAFLLLTRVTSWFMLLYVTAGVAVMINRRVVPEPARP